MFGKYHVSSCTGSFLTWGIAKESSELPRGEPLGLLSGPSGGGGGGVGGGGGGGGGGGSGGDVVLIIQQSNSMYKTNKQKKQKGTICWVPEGRCCEAGDQ